MIDQSGARDVRVTSERLCCSFCAEVEARKEEKINKKESRFRRIENARAIAGRGEERPAGEGERGEQKQTSEFQREGRVIN